MCYLEFLQIKFLIRYMNLFLNLIYIMYTEGGITFNHIIFKISRKKIKTSKKLSQFSKQNLSLSKSVKFVLKILV